MAMFSSEKGKYCGWKEWRVAAVSGMKKRDGKSGKYMGKIESHIGHSKSTKAQCQRYKHHIRFYCSRNPISKWEDPSTCIIYRKHQILQITPYKLTTHINFVSAKWKRKKHKKWRVNTTMRGIPSNTPEWSFILLQLGTKKKRNESEWQEEEEQTSEKKEWEEKKKNKRDKKTVNRI